MKYKKTAAVLLSLCCILMCVSCQKSKKEDNTDIPAEKETFEKGYELPISSHEKEEAEEESLSMMDVIKKLYIKERENKQEDEAISEETAKKMMDLMEKKQDPVTCGAFYLNMRNEEKMDQFLERAGKGEKSEIVVYELHLDGGIGRRKFTFDGRDMYELQTITGWEDGGHPVITLTSYNRLKNWAYTEKGWFSFTYCVPEPPEVSEVMDSKDMLRVKPQKDEYRETALKYLIPIAYKSGGLFSGEWDSTSMERLDYNRLYQYLYPIKYNQAFEPNQYKEGIPADQFEEVILSYFQLSAEKLRKYAEFNPQNHTYPFSKLGCGTYTPSALGSSFPEIIKITENADGTVTFDIDAVCKMLGNEALIRHRLTVQFTGEEGGIKYLSNSMAMAV